jgi:NAD(P)-dependent dehydrogenase (short-subunit alcohol dehydrogenase family)
MAARAQDKVFLVTGGASGIGKATALMFAREGAKVVIGDIAQEGGRQTVKEINQMGGKAIFISTDVAKAHEVEALINRAKEVYGGLDFALNNAGIGHKTSLTHEIPEEMWEQVISVNLKGVWLCMKYELPIMMKQRAGVIVNMSSIGGLIGGPGLAAYGASKGGINQLTKVTALEYAKFGIRVNAVCPSVTLTPLTEGSVKESPETFKDMINNQPLGRLAKPEEIASVVFWLCSDESSYVNGICLPVDGGFTIA